MNQIKKLYITMGLILSFTGIQAQSIASVRAYCLDKLSYQVSMMGAIGMSEYSKVVFFEQCLLTAPGELKRAQEARLSQLRQDQRQKQEAEVFRTSREAKDISNNP